MWTLPRFWWAKSASRCSHRLTMALNGGNSEVRVNNSYCLLVEYWHSFSSAEATTSCKTTPFIFKKSFYILLKWPFIKKCDVGPWTILGPYIIIIIIERTIILFNIVMSHEDDAFAGLHFYFLNVNSPQLKSVWTWIVHTQSIG